MELPQKIFHRDRLRVARAIALADAEGFHATFHALELLGQQLTGKIGGLAEYQGELSELASISALSNAIPSEWPDFHTPFDALFKELRIARNDAIHQGSYARMLAGHAIEVTIILEDALMSDAACVSQFMVREVIQAELWQPISYVRQQMLKHAFSYVPIGYNDEWWLVPDCLLVRHLRASATSNHRKRQLAMSLENAIEGGSQLLVKAETAAPRDLICEVVQRMTERPILIVDAKQDNALVGILTSADVL